MPAYETTYQKALVDKPPVAPAAVTLTLASVTPSVDIRRYLRLTFGSGQVPN